MAYMPLSNILFVFMLCHLIDVNWRPQQCSQSASWPLSGNVTKMFIKVIKLEFR